MSNSNGYNPNSLLALERSLRENPPISGLTQSASAEALELSEGLENSQTESSAFDWDEAIGLTYEQTNPSEDPENDQLASRALNWDEAIELAYEDEQSPEAEAMTWEDEESPGNDVQAFAVEEEAPLTDDPLSHSNSLFALEQSVYGVSAIAQTVQSFSAEDSELEQSQRPTIESQAFDWDEAIALEYEGDPEFSGQSEAHAFDWDEAISLEYEAAEQPTAESFDWLPDEEPQPSTAESFEWLPTDESSYGLGLEDEPPTFTVEAFAVEDEEIPTEQAGAFEAETEPETILKKTISSDNPASALGTENDVALYPMTQPATGESSRFGATDEVSNSVRKSVEPSHAYDLDTDDNDVSSSNSQAYSASEAIPVEATIVSPANPPRKSAAPIDFDALEQSIADSHDSESESADAQAFAADIAAILRGEKIYEPAATSAPETTIPSPQAAPIAQPSAPVQPPPQAQAQSLPPKQPSAHDIFDQMGRSMTHATAFDLGTFSLEQAFNEFDAILDEQEQALSFSYENEEMVEPETHAVPAIAQPFAWDEDELAADVEALSASEPWEPAVQFELERSDIMALIDNNPPHDNELRNQYFQRLKEEAKNSFRQHYKPKVDDARISAAIDQLAASKVTAKALKDRCWVRICLGGTRQDPEALTGYHWAGYEKGKARFRRVGRPTKPEDKFGVYQQKIQHKKTRKEPKVPVTFFPNTWTEQHFDDLFWHFAQRQDFDPETRGTYAIEAALNGDDRCIGMSVLFMPAGNGEGVFIPMRSGSEATEAPSEAQALDKSFSNLSNEEPLMHDEIGETMSFDEEALSFDELDLADSFDLLSEGMDDRQIGMAMASRGQPMPGLGQGGTGTQKTKSIKPLSDQEIKDQKQGYEDRVTDVLNTIDNVLKNLPSRLFEVQSGEVREVNLSESKGTLGSNCKLLEGYKSDLQSVIPNIQLCTGDLLTVSNQIQKLESTLPAQQQLSERRTQCREAIKQLNINIHRLTSEKTKIESSLRNTQLDEVDKAILGSNLTEKSKELKQNETRKEHLTREDAQLTQQIQQIETNRTTLKQLKNNDRPRIELDWEKLKEDIENMEDKINGVCGTLANFLNQNYQNYQLQMKPLFQIQNRIEALCQDATNAWNSFKSQESSSSSSDQNLRDSIQGVRNQTATLKNNLKARLQKIGENDDVVPLQQDSLKEFNVLFGQYKGIPKKYTSSTQSSQSLAPQPHQPSNIVIVFHPSDVSTWELIKIDFGRIDENQIKQAKDGGAKLALLEKGWLTGRHKPIAETNCLYHVHLAGGSWGLAFYYHKDPGSNDRRVTPTVVSLSQKRVGNEYQWLDGSTGYYPTKIALPPYVRRN